MIFLQSTEALNTSFGKMLDYGIVGAMLVVCLVIIGAMLRYFLVEQRRERQENRKLNEEYKQEVKAIQKKLDEYIEVDRDEMRRTINNNTLALNKMSEVIDRYEDLILNQLKGK